MIIGTVSTAANTDSAAAPEKTARMLTSVKNALRSSEKKRTTAANAISTP